MTYRMLAAFVVVAVAFAFWGGPDCSLMFVVCRQGVLHVSVAPLSRVAVQKVHQRSTRAISKPLPTSSVEQGMECASHRRSIPLISSQWLLFILFTLVLAFLAFIILVHRRRRLILFAFLLALLLTAFIQEAFEILVLRFGGSADRPGGRGCWNR
jgi:hypothetical protein